MTDRQGIWWHDEDGYYVGDRRVQAAYSRLQKGVGEPGDVDTMRAYYMWGVMRGKVSRAAVDAWLAKHT